MSDNYEIQLTSVSEAIRSNYGRRGSGEVNVTADVMFKNIFEIIERLESLQKGQALLRQDIRKIIREELRALQLI